MIGKRINHAFKEGVLSVRGIVLITYAPCHNPLVLTANLAPVKYNTYKPTATAHNPAQAFTCRFRQVRIYAERYAAFLLTQDIFLLSLNARCSQNSCRQQ